MPDNLAVRFAAGLLGPQWKQGHDRKKRLQRRTVLSDCRLMLRYALDEGCQISDELSKNIAKVDTALVNAKLDPLSEVPKELIQKAQSGAENQQPQAHAYADTDSYSNADAHTYSYSNAHSNTDSGIAQRRDHARSQCTLGFGCAGYSAVPAGH